MCPHHRVCLVLLVHKGSHCRVLRTLHRCMHRRVVRAACGGGGRPPDSHSVLFSANYYLLSPIWVVRVADVIDGSVSVMGGG
jgi:hypothetical protein